ncbi:hypothetical protein AAVH_31730, partial [Aphelenchoides avenae]
MEFAIDSVVQQCLADGVTRWFAQQQLFEIFLHNVSLEEASRNGSMTIKNLKEMVDATTSVTERMSVGFTQAAG